MPGAVLYPHETLSGDLQLTLNQVYLDDQLLPAGQIQQAFSIADLGRSSHTEWQTARLEWQLKFEPEKGAGRMDDFTAKYGDLRAWLALECRPTNLRVSLKLTPANENGHWAGSLLIDRENVAGSAKVQAWLAYDMKPAGIEFKHRVAAESYPWMVYLDPPRSFQREGGLQMHWVDFSKSEEMEWLKNYASAFSAIDMSPEVPRVLLNSGMAGLQELLSQEATTDPARETLRTMAATNVARGAWMALAHQAIESLKSAGGKLDDWSAPAWQREVLQTLALILGPNQRLADWLDHDGADWIREGLTPANWTKLDVAIGDWLSRRSNLATNWQKWSKAQAKTVEIVSEAPEGILGRIKKKFSVPKKASNQSHNLWDDSHE